MTNLGLYTKKYLELFKFKQIPQTVKVLEELEQHNTELAKLAEELKQEAKEKGDMENDIIKVSKIERYKKYYDYNEFIKNAEQGEATELEKANGIKAEIDKTIFDELVEKNKISLDTKQKIFRETLLSVAINIKSKL